MVLLAANISYDLISVMLGFGMLPVVALAVHVILTSLDGHVVFNV